MMRELGYCQASRIIQDIYREDNPESHLHVFFDFVPKNAIVFIDESHVTIPQIGAMYKGDRSRKETLVEYGFRYLRLVDVAL